MTDTPRRPVDDSSVVWFDGVCNLCNGFVRFVIERDRAAHFRFGTLQSTEGQRLLASRATPAAPETVVLVDGGRTYTQSDAVLRIAGRLRFPWPLAYAFIVVPRPLRDLVYRWVARHRYRWFGRREACLLPTPEIRSRFIH